MYQSVTLNMSTLSGYLNLIMYTRNNKNPINETALIGSGNPVNNSMTPTHQGMADSAISSAPFSMVSSGGFVTKPAAQDDNLSRKGIESRKITNPAMALRSIYVRNAGAGI